MNIQILHIGDLHINSNELQSITARVSALLADIRRVKEKYELNPSLVFFTGDLVKNGSNWKIEGDLALQYLINPILNELKLDKNSFFIVPGNHDVNRKNISDVFEYGLISKIKNMETLNSYVDSISKNEDEFKLIKTKLDDYFNFRDGISSKFIVKKTFFYNAYNIVYESIKVGIIELNSAWRSSQYGPDEGKLLISHTILNQSIDCIRDCDLRFILVHHPLEMLAEWNRSMIKRTLAKNSIFLFTGHIHDSDSAYSQLVFGDLYVCTCGPLWGGTVHPGYSIINLDLGKRDATIFLRKWYESRQEFDEETEKCAGGKVIYKNLMTTNPDTNILLEINELKARLQSNLQVSVQLKPLEIKDDVRLDEVFVDPIISDKPNIETRDQVVKKYSLKEILESNDNLNIIGKKEYGKSTLLRYLLTEYLKDNRYYENRIPVLFSFSSIPKKKVSGINSVIRQSLDIAIDDSTIESYLKNGHFILFIDDLYDLRDTAKENRVRVLIEFHKLYPKCRFIFTMSENILQTFQQDIVNLYTEFKYNYLYLSSFNTSKIRELIKKWSSFHNLDVDTMLNQIVFYFQQLKLAVTPMNITLFIGVLFRDKANKNIANEAYLIENYLEDLLEKLDPDDTNSNFGFRDKESFLAHIAFRMFEKKKYNWPINEFEHEKLEYFNRLGEDIPDASIFDLMFKNGILSKSGGQVRFSLRFCFNFFLAKAMQKDPRKKEQILGSEDYLKYASALSYKAGLDRNDEELVNEIDRRLEALMYEMMEKYKLSQIELRQIDLGLIEFSDSVAKEIKNKNNAEIKDAVKDEKYLAYNEDDQEVESSINGNDVLSLLTLYTDIIRNTTEVDLDVKKRYIEKDVSYFVCMMWIVLDVFKEFIENTDEQTIRTLLQIKEDNSHKLTDTVNQLVSQIFPASIINYLADHLLNKKLKKATQLNLEKTKDSTHQLFTMLLLLKLDLNSAFPFIKKKIKENKSLIIDSIISISLRIHCYENELTHSELEEVIGVLQEIREKHPMKAQEITMPLKDTFASDFRESVRIKRELLK